MCGCSTSIHCTYLCAREKKIIRGIFSAIGCNPLYINKSKAGIGVQEIVASLGMDFGGTPRYYYYSRTLHCSQGIVFY